LRSQQFFKQLKIFPHSTELENSVPCIKGHTTPPYTKPEHYSPNSYLIS